MLGYILAGSSFQVSSSIFSENPEFFRFIASLFGTKLLSHWLSKIL
jgi:hypothetical protein